MVSRALLTLIALACVILVASAAHAQILDIGTDATYAGPYPGGIENTVTGTVTIVGLQAVNGGAIFSGTGGPTDNAVIINGTSASIGSPVSGLFVNSVANTVELSVGSGTTSQGVLISPTQTVVTGGTVNPTALILDDNGATFANDITGDPVQIHGVADGTADFDAVNVRQLDATENRLSSGIASIAALAAIPGPVGCKNYSVGFGYGHFNGENAGAIGFRANLPQSNVSLAAGAGFSENGSPAFDFGASLSF